MISKVESVTTEAKLGVTMRLKITSTTNATYTPRPATQEAAAEMSKDLFGVAPYPSASSPFSWGPLSGSSPWASTAIRLPSVISSPKATLPGRRPSTRPRDRALDELLQIGRDKDDAQTLAGRGRR